MMCVGIRLCATALPSVETSFFRALINLTLLSIWFAGKRARPWGKEKRLLITRSLLCCITMVIGFYGTAYLAVADQSILNKVSIPFTVIFGVWLLGERISRTAIFWILLSLVGAAVVVNPSFRVLNLPGIAVIISAALNGLTCVTIRSLHESEDSPTIIFYFALVSTLVLAAVFGWSFILPSARAGKAILLVGITGTLGQVMYTQSLKYAPASEVIPYGSVDTLFGVFWGQLFFSELPGLLTLAGATVILFCSAMLLREQSSGETVTIPVTETGLEDTPARSRRRRLTFGLQTPDVMAKKPGRELSSPPLSCG